MNSPCEYAGMCRNAKPYCFDSDTFHLACIRRGWFECYKSNYCFPKCIHRDDPETCLDCDPFYPPCSLFKNSEGWY